MRGFLNTPYFVGRSIRRESKCEGSGHKNISHTSAKMISGITDDKRVRHEPIRNQREQHIDSSEGCLGNNTGIIDPPAGIGRFSNTRVCQINSCTIHHEALQLHEVEIEADFQQFRLFPFQLARIASNQKEQGRCGCRPAECTHQDELQPQLYQSRTCDIPLGDRKLAEENQLARPKSDAWQGIGWAPKQMQANCSEDRLRAAKRCSPWRARKAGFQAAL